MKLNIISILFILFASTQTVNAQDVVDCSEFKKGSFHYIPPNGGEISVKRTKKKQIERYNDEIQKFIFEINWTDNCSYDLVLVKVKGLPKEQKKEILGTTLHCKVVSASLGHYEIEITSANPTNIEKMTIYSNR